MKIALRLATATALLLCAGSGLAQDDERDQLKIAALEALISAPEERALPAVTRVLRGDSSVEVKKSALFILSQIDSPEAQALLIEMARDSGGELQRQAIEMIGIGGGDAAIAELRGIYASGDEEARSAVLDAYLIAGNEDAVFQIAVDAADEEERDRAIEMLAVMGARDKLRQIRAQAGVSEGLIEAYAISGDVESLRELALDNSNPERQEDAIESLGIVGSDEATGLLVEVYRGSNRPEIREAALEGMLIAGYDEGALELYRASDDVAEKRMLLEYLSMMGSDAVWDIIDAALEGER